MALMPRRSYSVNSHCVTARPDAVPDPDSRDFGLTAQASEAVEKPSTKTSDSRSKNFGDIFVERDAFAPYDLRALVEDAIHRHLPREKFHVLMAAEDSERDLIGLVTVGGTP